MNGRPGERRPRLRLFFALWPGEEVRQAMVRATRKALRASGGRPVPPENLHVTLAFLGSVDEAAVAGIRAAAARVRAEPFCLTLDTISLRRKSRLVWLAPTEQPAALTGLHSALWDALEPEGFQRERRAFRAHLTMVRKVSRPGRMDLEGTVAWPVEDFVLVRSVTHSRGAHYEVIDRWALTGAAPPGSPPEPAVTA